MQGKLIVFSAPSGSGKTTIVRHLLQHPELQLDFSVSATSRLPRGNEEHGKDYYFYTPEIFKQKIEQNAFIEYEEVYKDNYYGTLKSELERIWSMGKNIIFDIDVEGGLRIKQQFPQHTLAIFVSPPSIQELEKRLRNRQTETEDKIQMRLAKAERELAQASKFDTILKNDSLQTACEEAYQLVKNFID